MTTDAVGGVWQYSTDLARELARGGYQVSLAVLGPAPDEAQRRCAAGIDGVRLLETGLPLDWMCEGADEARQAAQSLARLAHACGADLIHCNSPALAGAAAFPVPVVAVAHGCIATWWQAAKAEPLDRALRWHGEMMRRGLLAADVVVAPSASFAATLQSTFRLPQMPLVVHNGRPATASGTSVTGGPHRLDAALTIGRMWDPVKNGALLDAAAGMIDLRFLAAGPLCSPHGEEITFAHIQALGQVPGPALNELLALRPIAVSAARFEPFGLAVLEAASAGCALVLSDIATFRELWDGAALFSDPDDAEGFAAAITRVHGDPALRQQLGTAAQARAARYTPAATADAVMALYRTFRPDREAAA
ncbi:glycosyltransferase family 4 protein [Erythrobacter sp. NFXS35]|uniref:glycosyltransferase family 4 protein n=1 Tax=Erythrobacter sp. NFXS35 TaxID=2818436 RepID=UPI0032DEDD5F